MSSSNTRKNWKKEDWIQVGLISRDRKRLGKESVVYEWGQPIDSKARKAIGRLRITCAEDQALDKTLRRQVPTGFSIRSPVPSDMLQLLRAGLPFRVFELSISAEQAWQRFIEFPLAPPDSPTFEAVVSSTHGNLHPNLDQESSQSSRVHSISKLNPASTTLDFIMPPADDQEIWKDHPLSEVSLDIYVSPLYRCILFSVSNNFAGLGAYSFEEVIEYLRRETTTELYELISASSCHSAKAIVRNLFKGAIEAGDAVVVDSLLRRSTTNIDPNLEICYHSNAKYTPIERASTLKHKEVIKVLLQYHADVNKTYRKYGPQGALDYAIVQDFTSYDLHTTNLSSERIDPDIIKMLLYAGGNVSPLTLDTAIRNKYDEPVIQIMREKMHQFHEEWNKSDTFRLIFELLRVDTCKEVVQLMVDAGADLNYKVHDSLRYDDWTLPQTVIDIAAGRADLFLVQKLVDHGVTLTGNTLACAVSSGDVDVVEFFLNCGRCAVDDIGSMRITPLAASIRLQDFQMRELLVAKGALVSLPRKSHFLSALKAASAVGDVPFLEYLINLGGDVTPYDLGHALMIMAKDGNTEAATMLINAGASLDVFSRLSIDNGGPALRHALERRDLDFTNRLLDAGADPNYSHFGDRFAQLDPAIQLAVKWGHPVIVNRLIFEGVDVNACGREYKCRPALTIAVENGDYDILRILLNAGAGFSHPNTCQGKTPLAAATKKGDMEMIQVLLDHGADPNDQQALQDAASSEVFDVLLARFRKIYPSGCSGFGGTLLKRAIIEGDEISVAKMLENGMDPKILLQEPSQPHAWPLKVQGSPFGFAINKAQPNRNSIVKLVLKKGCDPNGIVLRIEDRSSDGIMLSRVTALVAAVGTNDQSLVKLLLQSGADINFPAKGSVKRTPLQRAAELGLYEMAEYLIRLDANVNAAPAHSDGGTALQLAALKGNLKAVSVLLCHKADVDAPPSMINGNTALEGAARHGRLETVKMLLNARTAQSKGYDRPQFERAKEYAKENGHPEVVELIESYQLSDPRYI